MAAASVQALPRPPRWMALQPVRCFMDGQKINPGGRERLDWFE